ncbi:MAG TPA: ABC transporter ATP-binding protein, partial [Candidatus Deferrimicrobium sp.]|nr:ABC transporter ATP-binding protein [Candidatus Deferrimicrobium sp.]
FFVLLGPSGSGKTTLLRSVAGLEKPDSGEISLDDKMVFSSSRRISEPPEARGIGMVFQSYAIWPHLTVAENIGLVLTHGRSRLSKSEAQNRIRHALSLVQLDDFENRPARLLSGGQQQRVALARALAVNPALLLMDEPLSNLDARLREEVRTNIKKLATRLGITALYVTHDQVEAMVLADRIAVMAHGEILQIGNPFELYRAPANSQIAEFCGSSIKSSPGLTAKARASATRCCCPPLNKRAGRFSKSSNCTKLSAWRIRVCASLLDRRERPWVSTKPIFSATVRWGQIA